MKRCAILLSRFLSFSVLLAWAWLGTSCEQSSRRSGTLDAGESDSIVQPSDSSGSDRTFHANADPEVSSQSDDDANTRALPDADNTSEGEAVLQADGGGGNEAGEALAPTGVTGTVIGPWNEGVAGRRVFIGGQKTITGEHGRFSIDTVALPYDVVIAEPDGSLISVYRGLSQRTPLLSHNATQGPGWDAGVTWRQATVSGVILGDFQFPLDDTHFAMVGFRSASASKGWLLGSSFNRPGPNYGPMIVGWHTSASVAGDLYAIGGVGSEAHPWRSAFLAQVPLSLSDGDVVLKDLTLHPIATGTISGRVQVYDGHRVVSVWCSFRFPNAGAEISLGQAQANDAFSCVLPDLTTLGGDYCVTVANVDPNASLRATKCGAALGTTDLHMEIQAPPELREPANGSRVTKESRLSWGSIQGGVYVVDFEPGSEAPAACRIQVYTSATSMLWPNLEAFGIPFLNDMNWTVRVSGLLPYASMDALVTSSGIFALGTDQQVLGSQPVEVVAAQ